MRLVIFGLTVSSSWGNGHATLWRGLCNALSKQGHELLFFERDVPYYANHRDLTSPHNYGLVLYPDWEAVRARAEESVRDSDVAIVTSYCPDAQPASDLVRASRTVKVFYDLDTGVRIRKCIVRSPRPATTILICPI
jgi:spore maturation protein CgeB